MLHEQAQLKTITQVQVGEPEEESDEALAVRGDTESFVLLYRRHLRSVYGYIYTRLVNRQEAEDVTSLAFERAWQNLGRYRPTGSFKGWLFTIASRTLADFERRRKPHPVPLGILADVLQDPSMGPEEAALVSEQLRMTMHLISNLRREQQEIIGLRFMAGLQYSEIAQITGKKEAAVKMVTYRALEEVRRRYNDVQE